MQRASSGFARTQNGFVEAAGTGLVKDPHKRGPGEISGLTRQKLAPARRARWQLALEGGRGGHQRRRGSGAVFKEFVGLWVAKLAQPLRHGADIVVYSLTKYVGGHSDLVAGSIAGAERWMTPVRMLRNTMGGIADPNTAWMLLRSLETVELRMQRAGENEHIRAG